MSYEPNTEPRIYLRPILGPGDESAFPPGSPEYYVDVYGVAHEEAETCIREIFSGRVD